MEAGNDRLFEPAPKRRTDAVQPRQHEVLVEVLRFVTAALAFGSVTLGIFGRFHWFSNPRVIGTAGAAGVTFLLWLAIPRFRTWAKHRNTRSRDLEFVASQGKRLHKLLGQFKAFAHSTENESLVSILRSACVDESLVRQLYGAEYVSTWFDCLYEESELEAMSLRAFLNRCTQFVALMTEFNTCHVIPTQKQIEKGTFSVQDHFIDELEQLREDYNAFQRDVEEWTNELRDYSRLGWGEGDWWRKHSPAVHFERVRSFRPPKPVGVHLP